MSPQAYELLRATLRLAHATYGGPWEAARSGWQAPSAATVLATTDPRLHRCRAAPAPEAAPVACMCARVCHSLQGTRPGPKPAGVV